jgi:autotransporter family porin
LKCNTVRWPLLFLLFSYVNIARADLIPSRATTGNTIDTNGYALTISGNISGEGDLIKVGLGVLSLTGENTYTGLTHVLEGTLSIGNGGTTGNIFGDIANDATLVMNRRDDTIYHGQLTGNGKLGKLGTGKLTLTGMGSSQTQVDVQQGTLNLAQTGTFTTTGNFTTYSGATTQIGQKSATLQVGEVFTQQADSTLKVTLGALPAITADTALLDGQLMIDGFSYDIQPAKASVIDAFSYTLIHTLNGITGGFANNPVEGTSLNYLLHEGYISADGKDYDVGFKLAWTDGGQPVGTGEFTLPPNTAFDVDIVLADQTPSAGGFASGWDGKSLSKNGDGLLVLSANNTYTGPTTINGGILRTDIANAFVNSNDIVINGGVLDLNGFDQHANQLAGTGGQIQLNGATLNIDNTTQDSLFAGDIFDGSIAHGTLVKSGAGALTLSGQTLWTGDTQLQAGQLILDGSNNGGHLVSNIIGNRGSQLTLQHGATLTGWIDSTNAHIDVGSQWNMTANSQIQNLDNEGSIVFNVPNDSDFKTMEINGDYQGNNSLLVLNTRLGHDSSLTDKIVIRGNTTSGVTHVQVNNSGGSGAQTLNGIEVIAVSGQSDGEFIQSGRIVAGAYDYTLRRGDGSESGNWYLNSTGSPINPVEPIERPEAGGYNANLAAANTLFLTRLHDRFGENQHIDALTGETKVTSMWLRNEGGHTRFGDTLGQLNTQANRYVMQLGGDIAQWDHLHLGVMVGYGSSHSNTVSQVSGYSAKASVEGYSSGLYGTWYANEVDRSGAYIDSWAQYSWFNNSVEGQSLVSETYKSKGMTASIESGYTVNVGEDPVKNAGYFIQPKAQVTWMGVKADDQTEINGTRVSGKGDDNIQTRLGIKIFIDSYRDQDKGKYYVFQPFVETNWIHNTQDFSNTLDGVIVTQDGTTNIVELKGGVEGQIRPSINIWGNVAQKRGGKGYSDTSVMLGGKYYF